MGKTTIQDVAHILTEKNGLPAREAERFVQTMFDVVQDALDHGEQQVKIKGLGTFKIVEVSARESINVNTGERVMIDGHAKVAFTPDSTMKELVNKPFSQFETVVLNDGVEFDDMKDDSGEETDDTDESHEEVLPPPIPTPLVSQPPVVDEHEEVREETVEEHVEESSEDYTESLMVQLVEDEQIAPVENEQPTHPADEPQDTPAVEGSSDIMLDGNDDEETEGCTPWWKYVLIVLGILLLAAVCAGGGYYVGYQQGLKTESIIDTTSFDLTVMPIDTLEQEIDTLLIEHSTEESSIDGQQAESSTQEQSIVEPKPEAKPTESPAPATEILDQYQKMDNRVRYGAYRIVGLDYEDRVKAGETTARIAKRTLGADMECYIEVFNGITSSTPLKEGQKIKIPKLELKKKKKLTPP